MLESIYRYLKDEVAPRWWKAIFRTSETAVALAVAFGVAVWGDSSFLAHTRVGDIVPPLLAYAAIALGFCLGGLTVVLTVPGSDFAATLAADKPPGEKFDSYSELLFVFSWTAVCHWLLVVATLALLISVSMDAKVVAAGATGLDRTAAFAVVLVGTYCLMQFLIALIALSQAGTVYVTLLGQRNTKRNQGAPQRESPGGIAK